MDCCLTKIPKNRLFSGSSDSSIKVWNTTAGIDEDEYDGYGTRLECIETLNGHSNWVFALAFADGMLFSASSDHTIKVFGDSIM